MEVEITYLLAEVLKVKNWFCNLMDVTEANKIPMISNFVKRIILFKIRIRIIVLLFKIISLEYFSFKRFLFINANDLINLCK